MKKLLFILFVFLISCSTPEQKIIESFKEGRMSRYNKEIKSAEIYDTIYTLDALDSLPYFDAKYKKIQKNIASMDSYRDSIVKLKYPDSTRHRLLREGFEKREALERAADHVSRQLGHYYSFYNTRDSICGYFAKIYTSADTFDVVVLAKSYYIICPTFVFKNEIPIRPRRNLTKI